MIKVYHGALTRSVRIVWLLEELGVPYELATVPFVPPPHPFSQQTPTGKFPVLQDGDVVIGESGAIVEYLIERGGLDPRRLSATGFAEFHPRVPNDSQASRASNRRIDVVILDPSVDSTEPATVRPNP